MLCEFIYTIHYEPEEKMQLCSEKITNYLCFNQVQNKTSFHAQIIFRRVRYIEEAKRDNTQLLTAYRARMERREKQITNPEMRRKNDLTSMVRHSLIAFDTEWCLH